jgi:hypothetical protein
MLSSADPKFTLKRRSSLREIEPTDPLDDISMPSGDVFGNSPQVEETSPINNDEKVFKLFVEDDDSDLDDDDSDEEQD